MLVLMITMDASYSITQLGTEVIIVSHDGTNIVTLFIEMVYKIQRASCILRNMFIITQLHDIQQSFSSTVMFYISYFSSVSC